MAARLRLKDRLFTRQFVDHACGLFKKTHTSFDDKIVKRECTSRTFVDSGLKVRLELLAKSISDSLPVSTREALDILWDVQKSDYSKKRSMEWTVAPAIVSLRGMQSVDDPETWRLCMQRLAQLSQFSTSENAVRPFLAQRPLRALAQVNEWTRSDNSHVRRLASECVRPRLPWATRLTLPMSQVLAILSMLRHDGACAVRRSVANCLGDIAKDDPELVIGLLKLWRVDAQHRVDLASLGEEVPSAEVLLKSLQQQQHLQHVDFGLCSSDSDTPSDSTESDDVEDAEEEEVNWIVSNAEIQLVEPRHSDDYDDTVSDTPLGQAEHALKSVSWIASHGVRHLVKKGNPDALALIGVSPASVAVQDLQLSAPSVRIGESISFTCKAKVARRESDKESVLFQYAVDYVKARGTSRSVFLLRRMTFTDVKVGSKRSKSQVSFDDLVELGCERKMHMMTTRKLRPGRHTLHVLANGVVLASKHFELLPAAIELE
ncbi:MAG: hypothetical protein MHM6MM_003835 [Cercozoa sp. M6MM]